MTTARPILLGFAVASVALILAMICVDGLRSGAAWQAAAALTLIGGVVGSAVVGAVASRRAVRSIRQVTQGIDRIAAGDLGYRVDVRAAREAGDLASAFNRMGASLTGAMRDVAAERKNLSAVLNTMSDGVVVVDSREEVTLINSADAALFGGEARVGRPPIRRQLQSRTEPVVRGVQSGRRTPVRRNRLDLRKAYSQRRRHPVGRGA